MLNSLTEIRRKMSKFDHNDWQDDEQEEEEIIWVSKSEIKRDAEALKKIGVELVALSKAALDKIPLDEELITEIELAQKTKREGLRRQMQLIGKLLRSRDMQPILDALDKLKNKHNQQTAHFHKIEQWRDRLIADGDAEITRFMAQYPDAERQTLRSLIRGAQKEQQANKPPKSARALFQYLKDFIEMA